MVCAVHRTHGIDRDSMEVYHTAHPNMLSLLQSRTLCVSYNSTKMQTHNKRGTHTVTHSTLPNLSDRLRSVKLCLRMIAPHVTKPLSFSAHR